MTILVVGADGQLGQSTLARWVGRHVVVPCTRREVDLAHHAGVRNFIADRRPAVVINCAAYNDVDGAETDPQTALDVNAMAVRTLARASADVGAVLVHYSTDFVFAGDATQPYTEDDAPEPRSVYGQSKLLGEWMAAGCPRHYVLRVESLFGGPQPRSSVDKIIEAVQSGRQARVFSDRSVSPSFVDDVANATVKLVEGQAPFGLYHCVNSGAATWLEVGREIARRLQQPETLLTPVSVAEVTLRAPRPKFAALSNAKLARAGVVMPPWQDALARHLARRSAP